ncbi:SCO family protein [Devosia nitrariae]|uniref:Electron transporter SenC n=1 Tax=Devosia nitrariae TaxID=2071872 RepID=A0ABQ5W4E3_9HYPH|nr:SCO family protein [Devosia nitrariae]GLQ54932.1 electron transporter SenC [Devosia nitrariae]
MTDTSNRTLRNFRIVLWALVVVVAIGATALYLLRPPARPLAITGTPFALTATTGETFTQEDLRGTPSLVFFGFTHCPDVCPTTLAETTMWKEALDLTAQDLRVIFVTVDPERDDIETVRGYLSGWDPSIIGLVGDTEQTEATKAAFGVFSEKAGEGEYYTVNHTASVFLVGADGAFEGTIAYEEPTESALGKIRGLVQG